MKIALVVTTIIVISVCLCAGTGIRNHRRRSISESTRFRNEYDNSDLRVHRPRSNVNANEGSLSSTEPTQTCVPGSRWRQGCNRCVCSSRGLAACTYMACLGTDTNSYQQYKDQHRQSTDFHNSITQHRDSPNRIRRSENNIEDVQQSTLPTPSCVPGTRWRQACNSCWCTETGVRVCTLMGCLNFDLKPHQELTNNRRRRSFPSGKTRSQNSTPENENKCKHGTFWMNDCNRCRCLRGRYACTRMLCPVGEEKKTNNRANQSSNRQKSDI